MRNIWGYRLVLNAGCLIFLSGWKGLGKSEWHNLEFALEANCSKTVKSARRLIKELAILAGGMSGKVGQIKRGLAIGGIKVAPASCRYLTVGRHDKDVSLA